MVIMSTAEELDAQIKALMAEIAMLQGGPGILSNSEIENYKEENLRIERYLSDFTARQGLLLTIAGLLTILPFSNNNEIKYFLIWSMPFLILSIISYILSTKRINFISLEYSTPLNQFEVNEKLKRVYFQSLKYFRFTDCFLVIYFTSFILNFYLINFGEITYLYQPLVMLIISLSVGAARYAHMAGLYKDSHDQISSNTVLTVPCTPSTDPE